MCNCTFKLFFSFSEKEQDNAGTAAVEKPDKRVITLLLGHYLFWYLYIY